MSAGPKTSEVYYGESPSARNYPLFSRDYLPSSLLVILISFSVFCLGCDEQSEEDVPQCGWGSECDTDCGSGGSCDLSADADSGVDITDVPPEFVSRKGIHFSRNGELFYFAGANVYDFFTYGDGYIGYLDTTEVEDAFMDKQRIDAHMSRLERDGIKVVRVSAFSHSDWHGFEYEKGRYNEWQFYLFDYLLESARQHDILLLPILENYWDAYGGIDTRLQWEGLEGGSHEKRALFFDKVKCPGCFEQYKAYVTHFIHRVNHYSGIVYRDDPMIFAWELMNEPRYQNVKEDQPGAVLRAWVDEMGGYIKSIDSNHMVSVGIEGHESRYGFGGDEGNPFIPIHQSPFVDFTTGHLYPTEPWADLTWDRAMETLVSWIDDSHYVVCKPFVLAEFNSHAEDKISRSDWWRALYGIMESMDVAGSLFWWYPDKSVGDFDFEVLEGSPELEVFGQHAAVMQGKSH